MTNAQERPIVPSVPSVKRPSTTASPSAVRPVIVSIRLGAQWSGDLVMRCTLADGSESVLPGTTQEWHDALEPLVNGSMAPGDVRTLKYSDGVVVQRVTLRIAERTVDLVAKHSRPRGLRRKLGVRLLGSRERRGFRLASALLADGVATARPVAVLQSGAPSRIGWLLTEYLPDLVDLDNVALRLLSAVPVRDQRAMRDAIIRAVCDLTVSLQRAGWRHRDYKASNIMLENWDGQAAQPHAVLLDLEGLRKSQPRAASEPARCRHLVRLAASLTGYRSIPRTDYARFLRAHLAVMSESPDRGHSAFRDIAAAAAAYNRAAAPRRRNKLAGYAMD